MLLSCVFGILSGALLAIAFPSQIPANNYPLTPDNTCGNSTDGAGKEYTCDSGNSYGGPCCSSNGYCGKTAAYCGAGCQAAFGTCWTSSPSPSTTPANPAPASAASANAAPAKADCGWDIANVGRFTHHQVFDFSTLETFPSTGLAISKDIIGARNLKLSQLYTTSNVAMTQGSLQLKVPGGQEGSSITGAEVYTTDEDILYASVRTMVQVSSVPGTCHGQFFYLNDTQESDIEFLTGDPSSGGHFTNQPTTPHGPGSTTSNHSLPSDATTTFHEYRLDWLEERTEFYLDGVRQQGFTVNVPSAPGKWIWNNWSNGDPGWSAGPPVSDSVMKIQKIEMYYNRTGSLEDC